MATADVPQLTPLAQDTHADVCVVGAGIAGLSTAYLLLREGRTVVVLDDGPLAGGASSRTTAHLTDAFDDRYYEIKRLHGETGARLIAESHGTAIDTIEAIVAEEHIECDFERCDGYLFVAPGSPVDELDQELQAVHGAGLRDVERVEHVPLEFYDFGPALRFPRQAQFHPLKYLAGLAAAIQARGGRIYTHTRVLRVEGGEQARVETANGPIVAADAVVVATNTPINDQLVIHTKQAPYRSYVVGARLPAGAYPTMLLWDTLDAYHYIRVQRGVDGHDVLIVGGEDHKTGQADDSDKRYASLEAWTREHFPMVEGFDFHWSGQVMEPVDYVAFIGRNPSDDDNVYIATGDSGNGMTHGTVAGLLLTDLICGRPNRWAQLYDPSRITVKAAAEFTKENLNVAAQFADYATPGEVKSLDEIAPGAGAIFRRGLNKIAAYRDEGGRLYCHSAVCTHLRCIVHWNSDEKTWDCPCHGSRFDKADGHPINGPALHALEPAPD
jgi:glycine/D-amino acid oxidase-like deaminating enzyme/nitrite reductase/ring-hydroxylating ferredoxin subunit